MGLRNTILISALVAGLAVVVILYIRRGFNDLQGQIDDIETMLAGMPPELTSGQPGEYAGPGAYPHAQPPGSPGSTAVQLGGGDPDFSPDETLEEVDENDYEDYTTEGDYGLEGLDGGVLEYSLPHQEMASIATLSEPGVYETGVAQITVLPAGADQVGADIEGIEEIEDDTVAPSEAEDAEDVEEVQDSAELEESSHEGSPSPPPGDEFDVLTLPQLKARLKAIQPDMRGIARMKRAEVLDRLRSLPIEETE